MDGLCRGCRLDRTWFHLCFCAAVICSESLWQIQDGTGIVIVYDPQHAAFFLGNIRDGYGDLFRDSEENSVSVNRCSFGNYFFKDAFVDFWVFDVVEGYAFGSPRVPSTMNTGMFSVLLKFLCRLICSGLTIGCSGCFFLGRSGFLIGVCILLRMFLR